MKKVLDICVLLACFTVVYLTLACSIVQPPKVDTQNMHQITPERFEQLHTKRTT